MAVQAYTVTELESLYGHAHLVLWTLANGDTGTPYGMPTSADRSVHFYGTFGAGGSVTIQGGNEDQAVDTAVTKFATLHDPQGVALTVTTVDTIKEVAEVTRWIRPTCTAGDGTTAIKVAMVIRKSGF